ncbi:RbsD/FucU family protein [Alteribacillus sp. HJP-4]|uniref:RbsD/FucU family protein n=1 Tax=Alteribacillus sp. HJP-4 TaxID=2775394 RepID=UPI0035CD2718
MIKTACTHPEIMKALSKTGHGDKILIVDGHYPADSKSSSEAKLVYLNVRRGLIDAVSILSVLMEMIPAEKMEVMVPDNHEQQPIHEDFQKVTGLEAEGITRFDFYETGQAENVKLIIVTGEDRIYGNLLLTVGV